jgi:signal peptidase I
MIRKYRPILLFYAILLVVIMACGSQTTLVFEGHGMEPTIQDGQTIFSEAINLLDLRRGDVIYYEDPFGEGQVDRLIGFPGETLEIRGGKIYIDNQVLDEDYDASMPEYEMEVIMLGKDEYFVLGDNRNGSRDSHVFGPIRGDKIKGRIVQ